MISDFFGQISFFGVFSAFIFLIAIIDPVGNIPVTMTCCSNFLTSPLSILRLQAVLSSF